MVGGQGCRREWWSEVYFGTVYAVPLCFKQLSGQVSLPAFCLCRAAGSTHSVSASSAVSVSGLGWLCRASQRGRWRGALPCGRAQCAADVAEHSAPCLAATLWPPAHGTSARAKGQGMHQLSSHVLAQLRVCCLGAQLGSPLLRPSPALTAALPAGPAYHPSEEAPDPDRPATSQGAGWQGPPHLPGPTHPARQPGCLS